MSTVASPDKITVYDAVYIPYCPVMTYEQALITIGLAYSDAVATSGGRSLSRIATVVVNQGSFFKRLASGATCTAINIERLASFFSAPDNWPGGVIPEAAKAALSSIGRPAGALQA